MAGGLHYDSLADLPPKMRQQVAGKIVAKNQPSVPVADAPKESKYHNVKTEVNSISFDSKKEARRYLALLEAVKTGAIYDLRLQHDFTLQEAYTTPEGERIRAIRYKADFTYKVQRAGYDMLPRISADDLEYWRSLEQQFGSGKQVVEDTKSKATKTPQYRMKYKMMAERGYIIREV